jgi:hypothetical protein
MMTAPRIEGVQADTRAVFEGFPYQGCPQGHGGQFVYPDFGAELIEEVFKGIPTWKTQGVLNRHALCGSCGSPIDESREEPSTFQIPINLRDEYRFHLEITAPARKCASCGLSQVEARDRAFSSEVADAMIAAFKQVGL